MATKGCQIHFPAKDEMYDLTANCTFFYSNPTSHAHDDPNEKKKIEKSINCRSFPFSEDVVSHPGQTLPTQLSFMLHEIIRSKCLRYKSTTLQWYIF